MQNLSVYRHRHAELTQMIDDLRSLLQPERLRIRPNAKTAYQLLCALSEKVKEHLSEEDRGLYPTLLIHDDPKVKSIAWGFISGERPLRRTFDTYHKRWLKHCEFKLDEEEFLRETAAIFAMVADRIEREEQILFPKLMEIGVFQELCA